MLKLYYLIFISLCVGLGHSLGAVNDGCTPSAPVQNLTIKENNPFEIVFTWDAPPDDDCPIDEYYIWADGFDVVVVTKTTATITPKACLEYDYHVVPYANNNAGPETSLSYKTSVPNPFNYGVNNYQMIVNHRQLISEMTWDPVPEVQACIVNYEVTIQMDDQELKHEFVDGNSYGFILVFGCSHTLYTAIVTPSVNDTLRGTPQNLTYICDIHI